VYIRGQYAHASSYDQRTGCRANATGVWAYVAAFALGCLPVDQWQEQGLARVGRLLTDVNTCAGLINIGLGTENGISRIHRQDNWAIRLGNPHGSAIQGACEVALAPGPARHLLTQPVGNTRRQIIPTRRRVFFRHHAGLWIATVQRRQLEDKCPGIFVCSRHHLGQRNARRRGWR
jgi:hypothetical protein